MSETIVLVDENDARVGTSEKLLAHREGLLHRAFSIFVYNSDNQVMLQRRAPTKYHSGGLWSNTCCGHPRPGEPVSDAARRRLAEEMGFSCDLEKMFEFRYRAELDSGLIENEYLHVMHGSVEDVTPDPDEDEVCEWRWMDVDRVCDEVKNRPECYTYWFRELVANLEDRWTTNDRTASAK